MKEEIKKTDAEYIEEFYSIFKGNKFEASYSRIKEVDGTAAPYFIEDWLRYLLAQKNKEIDLAVSKERERIVEKAWLYVVKATEEECWSKDELIKFINTK